MNFRLLAVLLAVGVFAWLTNPDGRFPMGVATVMFAGLVAVPVARWLPYKSRRTRTLGVLAATLLAPGVMVLSQPPCSGCTVLPLTLDWSGAIDQAADPASRAQYVALAERYNRGQPA